jgi:hypothetical protein
MSSEYLNWIEENNIDTDHLFGEIEELDNKCEKCGKIPAEITYKNKNYCTWYCAKKG